MRVLVYTPDAPTKMHTIVQAFVAGMVRYGHSAAWRAIGHYNGYEPADLVITIGGPVIAKIIHKDQLSTGKPSISISDGFIKVQKLTYFAIMRNGFGAYGDHVTGCQPDRWDSFDTQLADWRKDADGGHILIGHQHAKTFQGSDRQDWFNATVEYLRKESDRKIVVRGHPRDTNFKLPKGCEASKGSLHEDFKNCHAMVTYDSNVVVDALIAGVPCFSFGQTMGDPLCCKDISKIENIEFPDRQQWVNDIAYTQWTVEEMREGLPWLFLTNTDLPEGKTCVTPPLPEQSQPQEMDTIPLNITTGPDIVDPETVKSPDPLPLFSTGAGNVPAPPAPVEDELTTEQLSTQVDITDPSKGNVKQLRAWLDTHDIPNVARDNKSHLVAKVLQATVDVKQ